MPAVRESAEMADNLVYLLLHFFVLTIVFRRMSEKKFSWSKVIAMSSVSALVSVAFHHLFGRFPDAITQWVRTGHF